MTTSPAPEIQIATLRLEIQELGALQARHEHWTYQTDDLRLHKAHMRVASQLEELVYQLENNLMTALRMIPNEGLGETMPEDRVPGKRHYRRYS
jgi:hypothetical protein